jgi:hypothetical protein
LTAEFAETVHGVCRQVVHHTFPYRVEQPIGGTRAIWIPDCVPQWVFVKVGEAVAHEVLPRDRTLQARGAVVDFNAIRSAKNEEKILDRAVFNYSLGTSCSVLNVLALQWQCARRR